MSQSKSKLNSDGRMVLGIRALILIPTLTYKTDMAECDFWWFE